MRNWCMNDENQDFLMLLKPCVTHSLPISFVCLDDQCKDHSLLCNECIDKHRNHQWSKVRAFFTNQLKRLILEGQSQIKNKLIVSRRKLLEQLLHLQTTLNNQIESLQNNLDNQINDLIHKNSFWMSPDNIGMLNNQNMQQVLQLYQREMKGQWIDQTTTFIVQFVQQTSNSIKSILNDLQNAMQFELWQHRTVNQCQKALKQYQQHLHQHSEPDIQYFRFNAFTKHSGIKINDTALEAIYAKSMPSKPVIIMNNCISFAHPSFGIEIIRLQTKAIFFASTTVFIGVCLPQLVKGVGFRKINQASRGSYLIGSTGWSYHHNNALYDRKDNVGWTFKEGDKIEVTVGLAVKPTTIRFVKLGRFYDSTFEMPLGLQPAQLLQLKPCISFDAQQGAIVKVYNQLLR